MSERFEMDDEQVRYALQALDISAINGIVSLAIMLKKRGLMTSEEGEAMLDAMSKPLNLAEVANNPVVQDTQQKLDMLFAEILRPS